MDDPLANVAFLASSVNRVRVLAALAEEPRDRSELQATLGVSRATAKRVLDGFEERGWAVREAHTYRTTPLGDAIAVEFSDFLDTIATMQRLSTVLPWLPEGFDVDPRRLADARLTLPTTSDSIAPVRRSVELLGEADAVRGLAAGIASEALQVSRDGVVERSQSFDVVFSTDVLDVIGADPRMAGWLGEILAAGGRVYAHENVEYILSEFDGERVVLGLIDEAGAPRGLVESTDEAVREWVRETFKTHRAEATPVTAEEFPSRGFSSEE